MSGIRQLRERLNVTQQQFAEMIGVEQGAISNYENGKRSPGVKTIIKISKICSMTVDEVVELLERDQNED